MLCEETLIGDGYSIKNAKITSVSITMEDHGCLCYWIMLEGSGWGCGFGGYAIGKGCLGAKDSDFKAETGNGIVAMMRIMNVVGVSKWEDARRPVRTSCDVRYLGQLDPYNWQYSR